MSNRAMETPDEVVAERLAEIRATITDVGSANAIIVAVTKGFDQSAINCVQRLGLTDIGENYAQELIEKVDAIDEHTNVHFMGRIQRNKVRKIADHVSVWHSVSRPEVITEIAKRSPGAQIFLQVQPEADTTDTKDGVRPDELDSLLETASAVDVEVVGLMTIGVLGNSEATKAAFAEIAKLADHYELAERSMGMSGDYRDALEAGSTMLRLGSVLFGPRPPRDAK